MTDTELCFTPATALAALIRRRRVSPLEVTRAVLARIEKVNPPLNAYCTVAAEQALAAARKATAAVGKRGAKLGPLHGVPVSIKDLTPTAGIRTTYGSRLFAEHVPTVDALEVTRLKQAADQKRSTEETATKTFEAVVVDALRSGMNSCPTKPV